jgi:hypothetical protein
VDCLELRTNEAEPMTKRKNADAKERARAATVRLPDLGGQGVLVPGGFVLTAAHCVTWSSTGGMVLGDHCLATVRTKTGSAFRMSIYAVEPVADIAVLGKPDDQEFGEDADAFEAFCAVTRIVMVSADDFERSAPVSVSVLTHKESWVEGTATRFGPPSGPLRASVVFKAEQDIYGGTSGGPVIDGAGRLVGIVSNAGGSGGFTRNGTMPRPHLALPRWVWQQIETAQKAG